MKYATMIVALVVVAIAVRSLFSQRDDKLSGESTIVGNSFVVAEYGYGGQDDRLLYAVIRSFPINASDVQKLNDPRHRDTASGVLIRDQGGRMISVGRDGTVYLFDGDHLRTLKVKVNEPEIGIVNCTNLDEICARFQKFEVDK